jgi:NIPSNAP
MIAEMRTYTVKDGMLETYLQLFNKLIVPNHKKYGIPILGAWLDKDKNQITWIRTFASREDRKNKLDIYEKSAERDAVFPVASYHTT